MLYALKSPSFFQNIHVIDNNPILGYINKMLFN